ncbi:MAG: potassium transporter KefA [Chitinophagia bacterium]|nr:potassium transporter KefA [Chitinophagia bacterium]
MNALLAIYIAQLIVWVIIHIPLLKLYARRNVDVGAQYAINQLVKYVVYTFALLYALTTFGINISLILGGAAALLVGIGLGLQQTFNDFISGIVLLFERTVSVGDVLEFAGTVGVVKKIGLRSSIIHTRPNVSMIVPNHLLVNEHVTNWTHFDDSIRFTVEVGVAYGSDTALVKSLLIKAVDENPYVLNTPSPFVRFLAFGDSSLNFAVYFFSKEYLIIEDIKSDIRLYIDKLFREYKVIVPFPQRVITMNKD